MNPEVIRVLTNVSGLLKAGLFQGAHAMPIQEAITFIDQMIADGEAVQEAEAPQEEPANV
jgi:hypothetical protein